MRLTKDFYKENAIDLAPKLLGKLICRNIGGETIRLRITETECYYGEDDTACHAHKGKTQRTKIMYEEGGQAYIYLCYGIHSLFNIVTGEEGFPEAVLIRGTEGYSGPGKLTKALKIDRGLNGEDLTESKELWLEDDGFKGSYSTEKRIGIDYATEEYKDKLWRFVHFADKEQTLEDILKSREDRAEKQKQLISKYRLPLISFTLNIPGAVKDKPQYKTAHKIGMEALLNELSLKAIEVVYKETRYKESGAEGFIVADGNPKTIKEIAENIEENHIMGRLFDMDVIDREQMSLHREDGEKPPRLCFICEEQAQICARCKRHTLKELLYEVDAIIKKGTS